MFRVCGHLVTSIVSAKPAGTKHLSRRAGWIPGGFVGCTAFWCFSPVFCQGEDSFPTGLNFAAPATVNIGIMALSTLLTA
jgi:hypothetical protein